MASNLQIWRYILIAKQLKQGFNIWKPFLPFNWISIFHDLHITFQIIYHGLIVRETQNCEQYYYATNGEDVA